jgi:fumarate reductase subunit C
MNRWQALVVRVLAAVALALAVMLLPLPRWTPAWVAYVQVPVVAFLLICCLGKLLYDTLFYNRYRP